MEKSTKVSGVIGWIVYLDKLYRTRYDYPDKYQNLSQFQDKIRAIISSLISGIFLYGLIIITVMLPLERKYRKLKSTGYFFRLISISVIIGLLLTNIFVFSLVCSKDSIEKVYRKVVINKSKILKPVLNTQAYIYDRKPEIIKIEIILILIFIVGYLYRNEKGN